MAEHRFGSAWGNLRETWGPRLGWGWRRAGVWAQEVGCEGGEEIELTPVLAASTSSQEEACPEPGTWQDEQGKHGFLVPSELRLGVPPGDPTRSVPTGK